MRILNAEQMREADRRTIQDIGIASLVLMENAGRQVVAAVESLYPDLAERRIAIVCGKGNNGGDGFVVARTLHQRGIEASVFVVGQVAEIVEERLHRRHHLPAGVLHEHERWNADVLNGAAIRFPHLLGGKDSHRPINRGA